MFRRKARKIKALEALLEEANAQTLAWYEDRRFIAGLLGNERQAWEAERDELYAWNKGLHAEIVQANQDANIALIQRDIARNQVEDLRNSLNRRTT